MHGNGSLGDSGPVGERESDLVVSEEVRVGVVGAELAMLAA